MREVLMALALAAGVRAAVGTTAVGTAAVDVRTFQFREAALEIPVGTEVVWSNRDAIEHTVTYRFRVRCSSFGREAGRSRIAATTPIRTADLWNQRRILNDCRIRSDNEGSQPQADDAIR